MVTLIQRTVYEIFTQIPHTAIYITNLNAQSNALLSSHIQVQQHYIENNGLLITNHNRRYNTSMAYKNKSIRFQITFETRSSLVLSS
jgi:hypothetical protein